MENGVTAYLKTGAVGTSRIILKHSGTGSSNKFGVVRLGDAIDNFFGKLASGTIAPGGTGTVNHWDAAFSGAVGNTIPSCYNHSPTITITTSDKLHGVVVNGVATIGKIC